MVRGQHQQPLPAHSKRSAAGASCSAAPYLQPQPLQLLAAPDPRVFSPAIAALPFPPMQFMLSQHHDIIMKQYNKAVAERLARIVEERSSGAMN